MVPLMSVWRNFFLGSEIQQGVPPFRRIDVAESKKTVVDRKIKAIFVETSVARRTIEAVQSASREKGHEVLIGGTLYSDAMGERPPDDTYPGMVRANLRVLVEALR